MADEGFDRLPPQDLAAEQALLGAVLISASALEEVAGQVTVGAFYRPAHGTIWAAVLDLYAADEPVDPVTVMHHLEASGDLLRVGGAPYLHTLTQNVPTATNAGYYARIVADKATFRELVDAGTRTVQMAYHGADGADVDEVVEQVQARILQISERRHGKDTTVGLDDAVDEAFERLAGPVPSTVPTGLIDLDDRLGGGMAPGSVYIVAARPGLGKSIIGANVALNVAKSGLGVLVCSLEMSAAQITDRVLANEAGVELSAIKRHRLNDFDWQLLRRARDKLRGIPLRILDTPDLTMAGARRHGEQLSRRYDGLGLVVIDYLQLMAAVDPRAPRQEQVAELSRSAKRLGDHLNCPVVVIAQTNRKDGERDTPAMGDLRESGALEADASGVVIIRRPVEPERVGELDLHVVKSRDDREGVVTVAYSPHYSRVRNLAREMAAAA